MMAAPEGFVRDTLEGIEGPVPLALRPARSTPRVGEGDPERVLETVRDRLDSLLPTHGAILLRETFRADAAAFQAGVDFFEPALRRYVEGQSQRSQVQGAIYTSTEYPADQDITLHNELSYTHAPPRRLYFFCEVPPESGGETPLVDCRRVLEALDPEFRDRFEREGVRYVKTMHGGGGFGKSWQGHFETEDRDEVERYLREAGVEFQWRPDGGLQTAQVRPAVVEHPDTGERLWFNQADLWHYTDLGARGRTLMRTLGADALPTNAYYGDGEPIPPDVLDAVRRTRWERSVSFSWEPGDFLIVDNFLLAHGRRAFRGDRRILVAMA